MKSKFEAFTDKELEVLSSWFVNHFPYYSSIGLLEEGDPMPRCGSDCSNTSICIALIEELTIESTARRSILAAGESDER